MSSRLKPAKRSWLPQILFALACVASPYGAACAATQTDPPLVYVISVDGTIDLGLPPFVRRVLAEATQAQAAVVILEINTFGGRVDGAVLIRDELLNARVKTVAFVNKRAISAGALISLAAGQIIMAEGATIGAAAPVMARQPGAAPQSVSEKTISYVRKEFRATADARKRPAKIAEAMVDADVEIPGLNNKGKLLTLTTTEALEHGIADARANTLEAVIDHLQLSGVQVRRGAPTWAEQLVRWLTDPVVSSLLMSLGMLGLIIELRSPGIGLPGVLGVTSLSLFFWGHWLVQLAGWEEILLFGAGLLLLVVELFLIPGFGVAGLLGITALLGGLSLSLIGGGATWEVALAASTRVALSLLIALAASLVILRFLPRLPFGRQLVLQSQLPSGAESSATSARDWLGAKGETITALRPAGIAKLDGQRCDVVSEGEFIDAGTAVVVCRADGNQIVVCENRTLTERS